MSRPPTSDPVLEARLRAFAEDVQPAQREDARREVSRVVAQGVRSEADLLALARRGPVDVAATACWLLGRLGAPDVVKPLMRVLLDAGRPHAVRWEAALAVDLLGSAPVLERLVEAAHNHDDAEARRLAAYLLGWSQNPRVLTPLLRVLTRDDDGDTRAQAAQALGYLGDAGAEAELIDALRDEHPPVRFWSIFALMQIDSARALPHLEAMLDDDAVVEGWEVGKEAASAIAAITASQGG